MLYKLGLSLGLLAPGLSLTTWADAEDFKQLYRNEYAQTGQQIIGDVVIPEFDEEGNPIPPANELYPVCFNDFQAYIEQIEGIIAQVEDLDQNVIPVNANQLWDVREVPQDLESRDLQNLADEYQAAQAAGLWPQVMREPVDYVEISNPHCDYLPEFIQMKDFIANRNIELEDKSDFASWLAVQTLIPADPCIQVRDAFTADANSLLAQITTQEQEKADLVFQLYEEFGTQEQTIEEFQQNLEEEFAAARDAGLLTAEAPLQDGKPETTEECMADTDPLAADIDQFAAQLKELEDFNSFPQDFLCASITMEVMEALDAANTINDESEAAIMADLVDLLAIESAQNPMMTMEALRDSVEMDFDIRGVEECDSQIQIPFESLGPTCENSEAAILLADLNALKARADRNQCLKDFVGELLDQACVRQHEERIAELDQTLQQRTSEQDAMITQLFFDFDFGSEGQQLDVFSEDQKAAFEEAVENGEFVGAAPLRDDKPTVPEECEEDVAALNDEIDQKAALLKSLDDFIEFLPARLCGDYNAQVQAVLDENADALTRPTESNADLLMQMSEIFMNDDESPEEFSSRIFNEFVSDAAEMIEAGFSVPNGEQPPLCALIDSTLVEELETLIRDTTEQLSYEKYLQDRLDEVCGESAMSYLGIRNDLQQQLDETRAQKMAINADLYAQLASEGTALEDYELSLKTEFEMFRDQIEDRSDISAAMPEFLESCNAVVQPIKEEIDALLAELNNEIDCIAFTTETVCADLGKAVADLILANGDIVMTKQEMINGLLDDLLTVEGSELDRVDFDLELQILFDNDEERPMMESQIELPARAVPETCAETVSFDEIAFIASVSERMMNYEKWLMNRLSLECGEDATELGQINTNLEAMLVEARDDKDECVAEFFAIFGEEEQTLEDYAEAWQQAYDEALAAGEAVEEALDLELPETAEACTTFVEMIELEIQSNAGAIARVQSCEAYMINEICSDLADQAESTVLANAPESEAVSERIAAILGDIMQIEGRTEDELAQLEADLRQEFAEDEERETVLSGIELPTEEVPSKCAETVDYTALAALIAEQDDLLSFERWIDDRRQRFCGESGITEFQDAITALDAEIEQAERDQIDAYLQLWKANGGDADYEVDQEGNDEEPAVDSNGLSFAEFVLQANMNFDDATFESDFEYPLDLPEAHESCKNLIDPLVEDINTKLAQLQRLRDSAEFNCVEICAEFQAQADQIVADNSPALENLAQDVVIELRNLEPVAALEGETTNELASRLHLQYVEDVENGMFAPIMPDFTRPNQLPEACDGKTDYSELNNLIAETIDALSFKQWLQDLLADITAQAIADHEAELMRLNELSEQEDERRSELIEELYEQFQIEDQTLEQFETFLEEEFNELAESDMLPNERNDVETNDIAVPPGQETIVEDLRNQIDEEADMVGEQRDFNDFAFQFVCEEICQEIEAVMEQAQNAIWDKEAELTEVTTQLQIIYGEEGQTRIAFETGLREEYLAQREEEPEQVTQFEDIALPITEIPEGCSTGDSKLDVLKQALNDLQDASDFLDFLMPRIDEAALILLQCNDDKAEIERIVNENFSVWSECINKKSEVLTQMFNDPEFVQEDEEFLDFLNRIRAQYDELKDDELIFIVDTGIVLPEVNDACPEDVHDQLWMADQFREILEDSLSYKEWLKAIGGGYCDVEKFQERLDALAPAIEQSDKAIEEILQNLYEIKSLDDEEEAIFNDRIRKDFDDAVMAGDVTAITSDTEIPETSESCGEDARAAHQSLVDAVAGLDDSLTYIDWLTDELEECCADLDRHYDGIKALADLRRPPVIMRKESLEHALWVFKGDKGDEELGTEDQTLEEFALQNLQTYRDTDPLIIPVMSLGTFIDVPELCPEETKDAAQMLLDLMAEINEITAYNNWMVGELEKCSDEMEMTIDDMIEATKPKVLMADQDKQEKLEDLFSFAAQEAESFDDFKQRIIDAFDRFLEESGTELASTGIEVPIVPELADDDTEEARDELIGLERELAYCLTLVDWLENEIFTPCDLLREEHERQLTEVEPMIAVSREAQTELLESLAFLKPEAEGKDLEQFSVILGMDFLDDPDVQQVLSGIEQLETPLVCQESTQKAATDLADAIEDLDNNLTFQNWLAEQNQECCWDLGLQMLNQRKEKQQMRATVEDRNQAIMNEITLMKPEKDDEAILADFTEKSEAGLVEPIVEETIASDVPEQCQGSTHDARQRLIDECLELNIQNTLQGYLEDELTMCCQDQADIIRDLIDAQDPELQRIADEKTRLFAAWAEMEGVTGEAAEAFRVLNELEFNRMFNAGELPVSTTTFTIPAVSDDCPEATLEVRREAEALKAELERLATLCDWLDEQIRKACEDQVEEITRIMTDNMNRIQESTDKTEWILMELFALDPEGASNLERFKEIQGQAFVDANPPAIETGITIPAVPQECSEEARDARRGLERFVNTLGTALALENWLQDKLQVFCDAIEAEMVQLSEEIQERIDTECGPETRDLLNTLYEFELSKHEGDDFEDFVTFAGGKRQDFEDAAADLAVQVQSTGVIIPEMPDHCDNDSQEARMTLEAKELELEDCLTFNFWLTEQLQLTCSECAMRFMMDIDEQTIILQAAELRIVDQLDNLYLLEDPLVDGEPESEIEYTTRKVAEFQAADVEPMLPDFVIPSVAEECHEDVKQLRRDLEDLKQNIGEAVAFEKWLKTMVKKALEDTEDEYREIIAERTPDAEDAQEDTVESLNMLMSFKKRDGETDEEFAARMKITFDRAFDRGLIEPEETGIEIPDLPNNAPPSTVGAMALLEKFDESLAYQLTYAKWLQIRLEDCCDDIILEYADQKEEFKPVKERALSNVAQRLTDLFTYEGDEMNMDNEQYAVIKRAQFDASQADPDTAIPVIQSGMVLTQPPDTCMQETFDALAECEKYRDALEDLLTFEEWLNMELKKACDDLKNRLDQLIDENSDLLEQKQVTLQTSIGDLHLLNKNSAETLTNFARRLRTEFEEDEVELLDAGIVIPFIPEDCEKEVQDALAVLQILKGQLDDCVTFLDWLLNRIDEECEAKAQLFQDTVENPPHTQMPGMEDPEGQTDVLVQQLFELQGDQVGAPSVELFGTALRMQFNSERDAGRVQEVQTGIMIHEIPESCQESTVLSREALVDFDERLQDTKTYNQWLREQLAEAQDLNEEECEELAEEYRRLMAENFPRIQESKDEQRDIKGDAYLLKAEEGESRQAFDSRLKREFLSYVPLPIDPEIIYMELPATCPESTREALEELQNFINSLSVEITYEDWLREELKECCDEIIVEMMDLADQERMTVTNNLKQKLIDDLYTLEGQEGESREDFEARVLQLYAMTEVERVETGIVIPDIPESCNTANPQTQSVLNRLVTYDSDLEDCLTQIDFLDQILAEACVEPRAEMEELLVSEEPRIAEAQARQMEKLEDLFVFKGLHEESQDHFNRRLRQVFDNYVTHRRKTGVVMPQFPESCDEGTNEVASELNDLLGRIADEETYDSWLKANLDACCDDRYEGLLDHLEKHTPELEDLQDQRDEMMRFLWENKAEDGQTLEDFIDAKDAEYAELLANNEVPQPDLTKIHHIVPEVPDACDQEVVDAGTALRTIAEGIEDLKAQLAWLQPEAEECCTAIVPFLDEVLLNKGPEVDFTQDDIEAWLEECFRLEGMPQDDLPAFKAQVRTSFVEMVNDGDVILVDPMIDVPTVPDFCDEEMQMMSIEADVHRYTVSVFQTMGPWLQERIDDKCDENAAMLDMIITINQEARADAQQDVADELMAVFPILANEGEVLGDFVNRITAAFAVNPKPTATGLPLFTESCSQEDSARLAEAEQVIEDSLDTQNFASFLSDSAREECVEFEMENYEPQIDRDGLADRQANKLELLRMWFTIDSTGPDGESFDEFVARVDTLYAETDPDSQLDNNLSGITIVDYPIGCDEYSDSIQDAIDELLAFTYELESCIRFENWIQEQIAAAMDNSQCEEAIEALQIQAAMLRAIAADAKSDTDPAVNDFLDNMDTDNVMFLTGDDYVAMTLVPQIQPLVEAGELTLATPMELAAELDEECDQEAAIEANNAIVDLAAQQTLNDLINMKVDEICNESLSMLTALIPQASDAANSKNAQAVAQLVQNFEVAQEVLGFSGTLMEFEAEQRAAFEQDRAAGHFTQTERFPFPSMNIPTGYCSDEVYDAVAEYSDERTAWNDAAGFQEWLENDLEQGLAPIVTDQLAATAEEVDEAVNQASDAIEAEINRIFEEDQAGAQNFADLEDARTQLLAQAAAAEPEDSELDATIPEGLQDLLGADAAELDNKIGSLEQQLATLKFLQEFETYTECGVYKEVLLELVTDIEEEAEAQQTSQGDSNNQMSLDNFFASGSFVAPTDEDLAIPFDTLPSKPADCDASHEETKYNQAAANLNIHTQFATWCEANPGDVTMGLCGPI